LLNDTKLIDLRINQKRMTTLMWTKWV